MNLKRYTLILLCTVCMMTASAQENNAALSPRLRQIFEQADKTKEGKWRKAPVIGITTTLKNKFLSLPNSNVQAVTLAGGIPMLIPSTDDPAMLDAVTQLIDGLLITGGPDINPAYYGDDPHEQLGEVNDDRDLFELTLFRKAFERGMPIFGICRGMQLINVAMGGTLLQDIPSEVGTQINHRQKDDSTTPVHDITITEGTVSANVIGTTKTGVNSRHHQCVRDIAPGLTVTAWSPDGVPEMMEGYPEHHILGIQSHPEISTANGDQTMLRFFRFLVKEAQNYQKKKGNRRHHKQRP